MAVTSKLIGICGPIGSGKDTIAGTLQGIGWMRYSMAKPLKDMTAILFGWSRDMVEGSTDESRAAIAAARAALALLAATLPAPSPAALGDRAS